MNIILLILGTIITYSSTNYLVGFIGLIMIFLGLMEEKHYSEGKY